MAVNIDWFPTILDFSNISYGKNDFEGKSLRNVILKDKSTEHEVFCWYQNPNYWAVRKGNLKLLYNPIAPANKAPITKSDSLFLVNVNENPEEIDNQAKRYPEKVEELRHEFNIWYKKTKH